MNQRKLNALWSLLLPVLFLFVSFGELRAQTIVATNDNGVTTAYTGNCTVAADWQAAHNAVNAGGQLRLTGACAIGAGTVNITKSLTVMPAASATATLSLNGAAFTLAGASGTTMTLGSANNELDFAVGTGTLTINSGNTLDLFGVGNTLALDNTGNLVNNGTIKTNSSKITGEGLLTVVAYDVANAPSALYFQTGGTFTGSGTFGNIIIQAGTVTIAATQEVKMASNTEFVIGAGNLDVQAGATFTVGNADNSVDFQHHNGTTLTVDAAGTLVVNGNYYATGTKAAPGGTLTVGGETKFGTGANYAFFGTSTFKGALEVTEFATTTLAPDAVTAEGNVTVANGAFNANLTLAGAGAKTLITNSGLNNVSAAAGTTTLSSTLTVGGTFGTTAGATFAISGANGLTVTGATTNAGTISNTSSAAVTFAGVTNTGSINHGGSATMGMASLTNTSGTVTRSSTGDLNTGNLTNAAGATLTSSGATGTLNTTLAATNAGTISNSGAGTVAITPGGFNNAGSISNTSTGAITISAAITNNAAATMGNTGNGSFTINGTFTNSGLIAADTEVDNALASADLTLGYLNGVVTAATTLTNGINVVGNFTNSSAAAYAGNVIVNATAGARTITPNGFVGKLTVVGANGATIAAAGTAHSLVLGAGVTLTQTAANKMTIGAGGAFLATNASWTGAEVTFGTSNARFGQVAPALETGAFLVSNGVQLQLVSNVYTVQAVLNTSSTVRAEFGANCFTITSSGGITGPGVVLTCGTLSITAQNLGGAASIRAWLLAQGRNPDQVEASVEIALAPGTTINLTDATAEGVALNAGGTNWKGVTLTNTQRNFVLTSGNVLLNDANLTLYGGFTYKGATGATNAVTASSTATTTGFVVFTNNTVGGSVAQANFQFNSDGVNDGNNNFTIQRLNIARTPGSQLNVVDGAANPGVPSTIVITERLRVGTNVVFNINDNNVRYIGGAGTAATRKVEILTNDMSGTGYFELGNNHINDADADGRNTITVEGAGSTTLRTQFRQTGSAGDRASTASDATRNAIAGIASIGNNGISLVNNGAINLGSVRTINDQYFYVAGSARVSATSLTVNGSLHVTQNNGVDGPVTARLELDGTSVVTGNFVTNTSGAVGGATSTFSVDKNGVSITGTNGLTVQGNIRVLSSDAEQFDVRRPARLIVGGSSATPAELTIIDGGTGSPLKIQRLEVNRPGGLQFVTGEADSLRVNDLLLSNGVFYSRGRLIMTDLSGFDFDYAPANTGAGSGYQMLSNTSIVTRSRVGSSHGQLSRNSGNTDTAGPRGAYSRYVYAANPTATSYAGGAPYTVQHIGDAGRYSGDEIPGLVVTNAAGAATNSVVRRFVVDLASNSTELEITKDVIVQDRLELLTGRLDVAQTAFVDIAPNMVWVHGHLVPSADMNTDAVIRYPNEAGNTATGAGATARYDLLYVSNTNFTSNTAANPTAPFEFGDNAVRHLTFMHTGGTKAAPVVHTLDKSKVITGSLRVVQGRLTIPAGLSLTVGEHVVVDGKYNGNNVALSAGATKYDFRAMVTGHFPVGREAALFPYNYGVGLADDGHGDITNTTGTIILNNAAGTTNTPAVYVVGYVQQDNRHFFLPNVVVDKSGTNVNGGPAAVTFEIDQPFNEGFDQNDYNKISLLSFLQKKGLSVLRPGYITANNTMLNSDAPIGDANSWEIASTHTHPVSVAFTSFVSPNTQRFETRGNFDVETGRFDTYGAQMTVNGNFTFGDDLATTWALFNGGNGNSLIQATTTGTDAVWSRLLASNVTPGTRPVMNLQVNGNFSVKLDRPENERPNEGVEGAPRTHNGQVVVTAGENTTNPDNNFTNRNIHRFMLAGGTVGVTGNYSFLGHADVTSGITISNAQRGLRGTVVFNGTGAQTVDMAQVAGAQPAAHSLATQYGRAHFNNVTINNSSTSASGGVRLATANRHMYVNASGVVRFQLGNVYTGSSELVLFNNAVDQWASAGAQNFIASGAVQLSGSNSFVEGNLRRFMNTGVTSGGKVDRGYIFPLGNASADSDKRYYRPMTIQFPQNLGQTVSVVANTSVDAAVAITPAVTVQSRANSNSALYNVNLDQASAIKWNMKYENLPALEPNIRLGVQGLITNNAANIDDMRIVAPSTTHNSGWSMAGQYDVTSDGTDDTFNPNDYVDGIPTFIQEGVKFIAEQYNASIGVDLRIATNNQDNPFASAGPTARVQVIHNSPAGAADVIVNGVKVLDDMAYQSASAYLPLPAGVALSIQVTSANGASTLASVTSAGLEAGKNYILIAQGGADGKAFDIKAVEDTRTSSTVAGAVQMFFSHGVTNAGAVSVERVSTTTPRSTQQLVAVNAAYGSVSGYSTYADPGIATYQIKAGGAVAGQFLFNDLGDFAGEAVALVATGKVGGTGANRLNLMIVDADGGVTLAAVTTSDEDTNVELPSEFALHGNFPNPFNPTTNIRFDLPEQANVRVEIVDLLGRSVMTLAPQAMSAGANKVITVDAARLSSGVYFYRVVAEGASRTFVQGSKFTLLK